MATLQSSTESATADSLTRLRDQTASVPSAVVLGSLSHCQTHNGTRLEPVILSLSLAFEEGLRKVALDWMPEEEERQQIAKVYKNAIESLGEEDR